jgi:hypothetical protein
MTKVEGSFESDSNQPDVEDFGSDIWRGLQNTVDAGWDVAGAACQLLSDVIVGFGRAIAPRSAGYRSGGSGCGRRYGARFDDDGEGGPTGKAAGPDEGH